MEILPIHVFKHSVEPMITLLNDNHIDYQMRGYRSGTIMASSGVIEVILNAAIWVSLASVIRAFIKAKNNREIIIKTKHNKIVHAKGLNSKQLQTILQQAKDLTAIDTGKE